MEGDLGRGGHDVPGGNVVQGARATMDDHGEHLEFLKQACETHGLGHEGFHTGRGKLPGTDRG